MGAYHWGTPLIAIGLVAAAGSQKPVDDVTIEVPTIRAADGGASRGVLYWTPAKRPKTVVVSMHPSSDNQRHFVLRPAAERGYAGFGIAGRFTGQDAAIHEPVLLDLAAAIKWLKEERGFTQIVLVGHSGGGSLMAYYQSQAATAPPGRNKGTPGGDPPDLNAHTMIPGRRRRDPQRVGRGGPARAAPPRSVAGAGRRSVVDRSCARHVQPGERLSGAAGREQVFPGVRPTLP